MNKYKYLCPADFIAEAERMAKRIAEPRGLKVWRGSYSGFVSPKTLALECLLIGIPDENDPPPRSAITLVVHFDNVNGSMSLLADNHSQFTPLGGGWHPLLEFDKALAQLPDMT